MYGTGNSTQHSVMDYMGKESEKESVCVHIELIHFAVYLKLTQLVNQLYVWAPLCPTPCGPMGYSPPVSSISQARILEQVAISYSRRSPHPKD